MDGLPRFRSSLNPLIGKYAGWRRGRSRVSSPDFLAARTRPGEASANPPGLVSELEIRRGRQAGSVTGTALHAWSRRRQRPGEVDTQRQTGRCWLQVGQRATEGVGPHRLPPVPRNAPARRADRRSRRFDPGRRPSGRRVRRARGWGHSGGRGRRGSVRRGSCGPAAAGRSSRWWRASSRRVHSASCTRRTVCGSSAPQRWSITARSGRPDPSAWPCPHLHRVRIPPFTYEPSYPNLAGQLRSASEVPRARRFAGGVET